MRRSFSRILLAQRSALDSVENQTRLRSHRRALQSRALPRLSRVFVHVCLFVWSPGLFVALVSRDATETARNVNLGPNPNDQSRAHRVQ